MAPMVAAAVLKTWNGLNAALRSCSEAYARQLLHLEQTGRRRKLFLLRIHSRLNYIRAARERRLLIQRARARTGKSPRKTS